METGIPKFQKVYANLALGVCKKQIIRSPILTTHSPSVMIKLTN